MNFYINKNKIIWKRSIFWMRSMTNECFNSLPSDERLEEGPKTVPWVPGRFHPLQLLHKDSGSELQLQRESSSNLSESSNVNLSSSAPHDSSIGTLGSSRIETLWLSSMACLEPSPICTRGPSPTWYSAARFTNTTEKFTRSLDLNGRQDENENDRFLTPEKKRKLH